MEKEGQKQVNIRKSRDGTYAAVPAFLLCAVTAAMLILDAAVPSMSEAQYLIYPLLMRIASAISLICVAIFIVQIIKNGEIRMGVSRILFLLFLLCILISTILNGFDQDALMGVPFRYIGVFDMVTMILAYMMCSSAVNSRKLRAAVLISFMAAADLIALAFLVDMNTGLIEAFSNKNEPSAIFFHGNHYAYFLVVAIVISAGLCICSSGLITVLSALSLGINLFSLAMNRSLGGILSVFAVFTAAAILLLIKGGKSLKRMLIPLAVTVVTAIISLACNADLRWDIGLFLGDILRITARTEEHYSDHGRLDMWAYTINLIKSHPLTGYGCEGVSSMLGERFEVDNPHNEILTYAAYYGIPAALIYVSAVITALMQGLKSSDSIAAVSAAAASAYFVSSMFGVAMFYTLPFFFVLLGMAQEKPVREIEKNSG